MTNAAPDPVTEVSAYVASLFGALGSRDPMEVLRQTAVAIRQQCEGLSAAELATAEAPGKWSMVEVVQHLADSELVGAFRFRMVLAHDRPPIPGYDQDRWAARLRYSDTSLDAALEQFTALREANLRVLERAAPAELDRVGIHAERGEESVSTMIRMYGGHDLVHLRQLARIRGSLHGTTHRSAGNSART
jgi:hypothetical protein